MPQARLNVSIVYMYNDFSNQRFLEYMSSRIATIMNRIVHPRLIQRSSSCTGKFKFQLQQWSPFMKIYI